MSLSGIKEIPFRAESGSVFRFRRHRARPEGRSSFGGAVCPNLGGSYLLQQRSAKESLGKAFVTPIKAATPFFPAEAYHQDFYEKSPIRYRKYRFACGRDRRVKQHWGERAYQGTLGHGRRS